MKKAVLVIMIEKILDQAMYETYIRQVAQIILAHGGEYIARSSNIVKISGDPPERSIVIGFDSLDKITECLTSDAYQKISPLRENSTRSKAFIIENDL